MNNTMDSKKSNKIRDIVRLQQILKKWRKIANSSKAISAATTTTSTSKSIKFLKRTLSLSEKTTTSCEASNNAAVPKGYLAVCVGEELKRFVIPTDYLGRPAFHILLREAEEEFGLQQTGVLRIPCEVSVFEGILKMVKEDKDLFFNNMVGEVAQQLQMASSTFLTTQKTQCAYRVLIFFFLFFPFLYSSRSYLSDEKEVKEI